MCDFLREILKLWSYLIIKLQNYKKINIKKFCSTFKGFCQLAFYFVSNLATWVMPIIKPILAREGFPGRSNCPSIDYQIPSFNIDVNTVKSNDIKENSGGNPCSEKTNL